MFSDSKFFINVLLILIYETNAIYSVIEAFQQSKSDLYVLFSWPHYVKENLREQKKGNKIFQLSLMLSNFF